MTRYLDWLRDSRRAKLVHLGVAVAAALAAWWIVGSLGAPAQPQVRGEATERGSAAATTPGIRPSSLSASSPSPDTATPQPIGFVVTPKPAPEAASGEKVAASFALVYENQQEGDTLETIRARLRPYDTAQFDKSFIQGGGSGVDPLPVVVAGIQETHDLGLAPDGHLVVVEIMTLQSAGSADMQTTYLELYLVRSKSGQWLVDAVSAS